MKLLYVSKKISYFLIAFFGCGVITASVFPRIINIDSYEKRLDQVELGIDKIKNISEADYFIGQRLDEIVSIIDSYNQNMDGDMKEDIANEILNMGFKYDCLDLDLICATITCESAWNPKIISDKGAIGLMQIIPETGFELSRYEGVNVKWTTAEEILSDPVSNIRLGCRYLSALIQDYEIKGALAAYNGGMVKAEKWVQNDHQNPNILHAETREYVPAVLNLYEQFQSDKSFQP